MKRYWLSLDPGITTGWALLDPEGKIAGTSVWGTHEIEVSLDQIIRRVFSSGHELTVVIEQMPSVGGLGQLAAKLEHVRRTILKVVVDNYELKPVYVPPGVWKTSRVANTMKVPYQFQDTPLLVHQRDAIRMGRYAMDKAGAFAKEKG